MGVEKENYVMYGINIPHVSDDDDEDGLYDELRSKFGPERKTKRGDFVLIEVYEKEPDFNILGIVLGVTNDYYDFPNLTINVDKLSEYKIKFDEKLNEFKLKHPEYVRFLGDDEPQVRVFTHWH